MRAAPIFGTDAVRVEVRIPNSHPVLAMVQPIKRPVIRRSHANASVLDLLNGGQEVQS